jgi:hypothetical protein
VIRHQWTVICGQYLVDRVTGLLSMIDLFDTVRMKKIGEEGERVVYKPIVLNVVTAWMSDDRTEKASVRLRVFEGITEKLVSGPIPINFNSRGKTRTIAEFSMPQPVPAVFDYVIELSADRSSYNEVARATLEILPAKSDDTSTGSSGP